MKRTAPAANPDAYVAALDGWRLVCVTMLRRNVRAAAKLDEVVKWGHLVYFAGAGPVLLIRAEEKRVLFGFWRGKRLREIEPRLKPGGKYELATLDLREGDRIAATTARRLVKEAVALGGKLGNATKVAKRGARPVAKGSAGAVGRREAKIAAKKRRRTALPLVLAALATATPSFAGDCTADALRKELTERAAEDQSARAALLASPGSNEVSERVLRIDADNTAFMRSVLAECGWPRQSVVGEDAATAAWLLTQHADMDPQYQAMAAQAMKYAVLAKEASPVRLALLVDRNRRLTDQPQVYGMQTFTGTDGVVRFFDIVTPERLDARRAEIGLASFYCHAREVSRQHGDAPVAWPEGVLFVPVDCEP